jgi:hypothetical protein
MALPSPAVAAPQSNSGGAPKTANGQTTDVLESYKQTIDRWVAPDLFRRQSELSVAKAKQAIADYKKAAGGAAGAPELMVFASRGRAPVLYTAINPVETR